LFTAIAILFLVFFSATVGAGGWVIVSVNDLPEYAVAGKPLQLRFTVWDVGGSPASDLKPTVSAKSGTDMLTASAVAAKKAGEYGTTLVLPRPGNWTIRLNAFADSSHWESNTLPALTVIAPGSPEPRPLSQVDLGERLFAAKDCIACHVSRGARLDRSQPELMLDPGTDLKGKRFPDAFLKRLLAEPQAVFASKSDSQPAMFNPGLSQPEIAALTAFINSGRLR
jgi:mono/diheme cytochrome c family protein